MLCLRESGGLRRETGKWLVGGAVRTQTTFIVKFVILHRHSLWHPPPQTVAVDHRSQITITHRMIIKILRYCENYQNVTQTHEVSKCCWKMAPIDLLEAGLPHTFNV